MWDGEYIVCSRRHESYVRCLRVVPHSTSRLLLFRDLDLLGQRYRLCEQSGSYLLLTVECGVHDPWMMAFRGAPRKLVDFLPGPIPSPPPCVFRQCRFLTIVSIPNTDF